MTANKPEVFRFDCHGHNAPAYSCNKPADNSGEYVRLGDYEALQAEREQLVEALEKIAQSCDSGRHDGLPEEAPALSDAEAWLVANDALAAHRKEG